MMPFIAVPPRRSILVSLTLALGLCAAACESTPQGTSEGASPSAPASAKMVSAQTTSSESAAPPASAPPPPSAESSAAERPAESAPAAAAAPSASAKTASKTAPPGDSGGPLLRGSAPAPEPPKPVKTAAPVTSAAASAAPAPAPLEPPPALPPPAPGSADEIASQIDTIFLGKKTFKARFKQEHTQKATGIVKKSAGTVYVEKPNKLSFRYDAPNNNRIVSDGTTLKVYIAEDSQMFLQPVQKTEYPGALSFLMGNGLRPSFVFSIHEKAKFEGGPVLNGKPRAPTPYYEYVLFYVDKALLEKKDPGVMRRVLIVDAQGNKNRFDFEDVSQPASIDPNEFIFNPPAGTAIQQGSQSSSGQKSSN